MRFALRTQYALRALVSLAEAGNGGLLRIRSISQQQSIPQRFLEQILNELRAGGFLESRRGAAGGYRLARPPQAINLAELLQYLEGAFTEDQAKAVTPKAAGRRTDEVWTVLGDVEQEARAAARAVLEKITLADLCERVRMLREKARGEADFVI